MPLPSLELRTSRGVAAFSSGRPTLLCFVGDGCPASSVSMPLIAAAEEAFGGSLDVLVVGADAEAEAAFGVVAVPTIVLADREGEAVLRFAGFERKEWHSLFERLISVCLSPAPIVDWKAYPESEPACPPRDPSH